MVPSGSRAVRGVAVSSPPAHSFRGACASSIFLLAGRSSRFCTLSLDVPFGWFQSFGCFVSVGFYPSKEMDLRPLVLSRLEGDFISARPASLSLVIIRSFCSLDPPPLEC